MIVSTRGRYALRVMLDLAAQDSGEFIPLKAVAERQGISQKYLEGIMVILSKAGMVDGAHGKGGGYRLNRPAQTYRVGDILRLTENSLAPVACLDEKTVHCQRAQDCLTLPMWERLDEMIQQFFDGITLVDLLRENGVPDGGEG